ncbi:DUF4307 domain-containing protein [Phytomonospora endophytica]|uniref:DUF4307 domain-containing protein n=1 Tax=Phytomonospora endophytica TaxID=714109 RepID=A0A841FWZ5_9ACTN|nr:DUF4307 domain-containing protein [Phytomonospora endophytica]MBB6036490.1 hypothetical protein [Phytomonospora endophytica]GIG65812.1 hypothetical protein Pen01_21070 [Phytomonospora endophytica]
MSETRTTPVRFPPGRYGRRRDGRKVSRPLVVIAAALVVAGGVAVAVKLYQQYGDPAYTASTVGYELTDATADITFQVTKPGGTPALCQVRARSRDGAEVGRAEVAIPPGEPGGDGVTVTYSLATSARAVVVEVQRCYPVQP